MSETKSQPSTKRPLPPRVSAFPLVGCLPSMIANPLAFIDQAHRDHGDIFMMDLGFAQAIGLCNPRHVHHVLVEKAQNYSKDGPLWKSLRTFMGNSLPMSEGAFWKRQRRMVQPAFHHQRLSSMTDAMVEAIDECLLEWDLVALDNKPMDVSVTLFRMTMNVLVRTLFGSVLNKEETEKVAQSFTFILEYMNVGMVTSSFPGWLPVPGRERFWQSVKVVDDVIERLIEYGREHPSQESNLLAMMLEAVDGESGEQMTNAQLRDEVLGFFIAGYDTTAAAMTWVLHALNHYPAIANRAREELESVVGARKPGFADLTRMPYARNVMQESLRLYPPSIWLPRLSVAEDEIDGYRIPPGVMMVILTRVIHRHPGFWEDPMTFDPERFTPERSAGRHKLAWIPFGAGQRQCIAKEFAMLEGMLIMARILSRYELSSVEGRVPQERLSVTLRTKDGMWLNLRPRLPEAKAVPRIHLSGTA